jgi:hypothetical protein
MKLYLVFSTIEVVTDQGFEGQLTFTTIPRDLVAITDDPLPYSLDQYEIKELNITTEFLDFTIYDRAQLLKAKVIRERTAQDAIDEHRRKSNG